MCIIVMEIKSIVIREHLYFSGMLGVEESTVHIKQLPYLSVVQSKVGSYGIRLDGGDLHETGSGGIFIAPSQATQEITHHLAAPQNSFAARFIFIDVLVNNRYRLDDIFDFPIVLDNNSAVPLNATFDELDRADCLCDTLSILYKCIKHLLSVGTERKYFRNGSISPLIDYIEKNYMHEITVGDMASMLNMSESNLYAVFRRITGKSPIRYLNDYRLSLASLMLTQTGKTIWEIGESVGITDRFYFSKLFKEKYLMPPQEYRRVHQSNNNV